MSSLSDAPQAALLHAIVNRRNIRTFVETGTAHGTSAFYASGLFDRVITIDKILEFQDEARRRQAEWQKTGLKLDSIEYVLGDSKEVFEPIVTSIEEPVVYWLDSHSYPGGYNSDKYECTLMHELDVINKYGHGDDFILIDDVHDLDPPMCAGVYPSLKEVIEAGVRNTGRICAVAHDVVVLAPEGNWPILRSFA